MGELNRGLHVVASPVLGPNRAPIGFVEIFVLFSAKAAHRFGPMVAEAGRKLSRQLGADVDETRNAFRRSPDGTAKGKEKYASQKGKRIRKGAS